MSCMKINVHGLLTHMKGHRLVLHNMYPPFNIKSKLSFPLQIKLVVQTEVRYNLPTRNFIF